MIVIYESCGLSINLNREVDTGQRYDRFPVHFIVALIHIVIVYACEYFGLTGIVLVTFCAHHRAGFHVLLSSIYSVKAFRHPVSSVTYHA